MGPYRSPALEDEVVRAKEYDHQAGVIRSHFSNSNYTGFTLVSQRKSQSMLLWVFVFRLPRETLLK